MLPLINKKWYNSKNTQDNMKNIDAGFHGSNDKKDTTIDAFYRVKNNDLWRSLKPAHEEVHEQTQKVLESMPIAQAAFRDALGEEGMKKLAINITMNPRVFETYPPQYLGSVAVRYQADGSTKSLELEEHVTWKGNIGVHMNAARKYALEDNGIIGGKSVKSHAKDDINGVPRELVMNALLKLASRIKTGESANNVDKILDPDAPPFSRIDPPREQPKADSDPSKDTDIATEPPPAEPEEQPEEPSVFTRIGNAIGSLPSPMEPLIHAKETYDLATRAGRLSADWAARPLLSSSLSAIDGYPEKAEQMNACITSQIESVLTGIPESLGKRSFYDILSLPFQVFSGVSRAQRQTWKAHLDLAEACMKASDRLEKSLVSVDAAVQPVLLDEYAALMIDIRSGAIQDFASINTKIDAAIDILDATEAAMKATENVASVVTSLHPGVGFAYTLSSNVVKVSTGQRTGDEAALDIALSLVGGKIVRGVSSQGMAILIRNPLAKATLSRMGSVVSKAAQQLSKNPAAVQTIISDVVQEIVAFNVGNDLKDMYADLKNEILIA